MRLARGIVRTVWVSQPRRNFGFRDFFGFFNRRNAQIEQLKTTLAQGNANPILTARTNLSLASLLLKETKIDEALSHAQTSFSLLREMPLSDASSKSAAHDASRLLMEILTLSDKISEATEAAEVCERLARELFSGDNKELARSLFGVSYVAGRTKQVQKAEKLCEEAAEILRVVKDDAFLGDVLNSLGSYYLASEKKPEAVAALTEAISLFESSKYYSGLPSAYLTLSDVFAADKNLPKVKECATKAYELMKTHGKRDAAGMFLCCSRLAVVYFQEENYAEALFFLTQKARLIPEESTEARDYYVTLRLTGSCEVMLGRAKKGRGILEQALPLAKEDPAELCKILKMLCRACHSLKDSVKLNEYSEQMMTLATGLRDDSDAPSCLLDYALYKEEAEDKPAVVSALTQCVEMASAQGSSFAPIAALNLGYFYARQKEYMEALPHLRKGCELLAAMNSSESEELADSLHDLAIIETTTNQLDDAEASFRKSLELKKKVRPINRENVFKTRKNLAQLLKKMNKYEAARSVLVEGLEGAPTSETYELTTILDSLPKS